MRIKDNKCSKCGHDNFFFADKGNQTGIYCSYCGKWLKWADKDEQNLRMKQESVIDKIKAEIEQDAFTDVNGWKYIFVNRINQIIDKCISESEDKK